MHFGRIDIVEQLSSTRSTRSTLSSESIDSLDKVDMSNIIISTAAKKTTFGCFLVTILLVVITYRLVVVMILTITKCTYHTGNTILKSRKLVRITGLLFASNHRYQILTIFFKSAYSLVRASQQLTKILMGQLNVVCFCAGF